MPSLRKRMTDTNETAAAPSLSSQQSVQMIEQPIAVDAQPDRQEAVSGLRGQIDALRQAERIVATDPDAGLLPEELAFERRHGGRAVRNDPRLLRALGEMQRGGVVRGSPEYFAKLESAMMTQAFATDPDQHPAPQEQEQAPRYVGPVVQAPVTRDSGSHAINGTPNNSRVVLSREARDLCASLGIDETTYAKQVLRLRNAKAAGLVQDQ